MAYRETAEHAWTESSVRLVNTPSAFARSALLYVQEIGHFEALPSYFTERESLESFLIVYTVSGAGTLTYEEQTWALRSGCLFFIDCMKYQHYRTSGERWELLWVHLNGVSARALYERFANAASPVQQWTTGDSLPLLFRQLIELSRVKSIRNELLSAKLLVDLVTSILTAESVMETETADVPDYVADAIKLIETSYAEKLTLDDIAARLSLNKHYLAKIFKKHTGFSPGEYMINKRITRAKELLKYSSFPVARIAEQVGIDNISHFINLFKNRTGQTPLAFRKTWHSPE